MTICQTFVLHFILKYLYLTHAIDGQKNWYDSWYRIDKEKNLTSSLGNDLEAPGGVEPSTFRLLGGRSNQLSYRACVAW